MSGGRLDGKVAIITGASTGLGPVMAAMFVREGAQVLLAARREELVQEAAAAAGGGAVAMRADVTNEDDVAAMVARGDRRVRPGRHDVQQRRRTRDGPLDLGADARELERDHRHRRHRGDALHPRGAEPVDARASVRRDPELLVDGRATTAWPARRTTSPRRRRCARSPRRWRSRSVSTASGATASCPAASTRSCGGTGCSESPTSRASTSRPSGRAAPGVALRDISSAEDVANLALFLASDESRTITGQSIPVDAGGVMQG